MGTFDSHGDTPGLIHREGEEVRLKFQRSGNTTGRVSWNIPPPALGCAAEDQAYCGMLVTLDTVPSSPETAPVDGTLYKADPTGDRDLHAGDKIGTALVIGAFYEGVKKGTGEQLTTFFDITGLDATAAYYVTGYAVDCEQRYHTNGARGYSDNEGGPDLPDRSGFQMIGFNPTPASASFDADLLEVQGSGQWYAGILPTDGTGLVYGTEYEFTFYKDQFFESEKDPGTRLTLLGENAMTYADLVDELNRQFVLLETAGVPSSPSPPGEGTYYWDGEKLFLFDGTMLIEQDVLVEPTDPSVRNVGDYWFDTENTILYQWDGAMWVQQFYITFLTDPTQPECDTYWYDGTDIFQWNGTLWCETDFCIQTTDPALPPELECGDYWYDEANQVLNEWDHIALEWKPVYAVLWPSDPNAPVSGTYWYKTDTEELFIRNIPLPSMWNPVNTAIYTVSEEEPFPPNPGDLWVQPVTLQLFQRNAGNTEWDEIPAFFEEDDPTDRESCDLWWQTGGFDILRAWNTQNNTWTQVKSFTISDIDPSLPPVLPPGKVWLNPDTGIMYVWDGNCWLETPYIDAPFNPLNPPVGTEWYNGTEWFVWNGASWDPIDPIESDTDPNMIPLGIFWYDTTNDALFQWNGTAWVPIMFVTTDPTPTAGDQYYDLTEEVCYEWNGSAWVQKEPSCLAELDECGNLFLSSTTEGSGSSFVINKDEPYTLFENLEPMPTITPPVQGDDGVKGIPSYDQVGCGTDGTPDERRELAHSLRVQLGYPTVEVELSQNQLDEAIQGALEDYRQRSARAYRRVFFFLDLKPGFQRYILANERVGYHCIVNVMDIRRLTSAFLTTAFGSGAYGQVVLQHLYNMGTFDLLSYDLVSQYIEQLEHLFASRMTWTWNEYDRALDIYQTISTDERVLVDAMVERTEQEILVDRWSKQWIERRALVECRLMLAEIRGKYGSLPGAGGGVQLNAAELISRAEADLQRIYEDIDNFVNNDPESVGQGSTFVIG